jgi:K+/H+ antiporter YhaU regulatory subunit KhtT
VLFRSEAHVVDEVLDLQRKLRNGGRAVAKMRIAEVALENTRDAMRRSISSARLRTRTSET